MANTSCNEKARELLAQCLGGDWQVSLVDELLRAGCDGALFRIVAEGLGDRFEPHLKRPAIAVSLGTGENPAKRLPDPFEAGFIEQMAAAGAELWIDSGAGGEESDRVAAAAKGVPHRLWQGPFAGFASIIASSDLYAGYDSAGQHVAAASRVPQITVFAGEPCERMFQRWRPTGHDKIRVLRANGHSTDDVLFAISVALRALL